MFRWLTCLWRAAVDTAAIIWITWRYGRQLKEKTVGAYPVMIRSWCFGPQSLARGNDFYFGALPQQLEARGIPVVLLCGDTGWTIRPSFARGVLGQRWVRAVPEPLVTPWWAPFAVAWQQLWAALELRRRGAQERSRAARMVCGEACRECVTPATLRSALAYYTARAAVARWRPRAFLTTYEGQPWEQPAWQGVKAADEGCLTVGYEHSIVMPHALSLTQPIGDSWHRAAPDVLLCLSETTMRMVREGHAALGTRLVPFGSFRAAPDAREEPPRPGRKTVLVIPEGILSEATVLFNFALKLAPLVPDHRVILRSHPVLPFKRVRAGLAGDVADHENIELSACPIEEDFRRASAVVYRGSSAVLYAIRQGLKPVYVEAEGHPEVDPLFELSDWRERSASAAAAAAILRRYAQTAEGTAAEAWREAAAYASTYTQAVDDGSIHRLLAVTGLVAERVSEGVCATPCGV